MSSLFLGTKLLIAGYGTWGYSVKNAPLDILSRVLLHGKASRPSFRPRIPGSIPLFLMVVILQKNLLSCIVEVCSVIPKKKCFNLVAMCVVAVKSASSYCFNDSRMVRGLNCKEDCFGNKILVFLRL